MALSRPNNRKYDYQPYQMRNKAHFGHDGFKENAQGVNVPSFVDDFSLHYANVNQTMNQRYLAAGTDMEYTTTIAVHHDKRLHDQLRCKLADGKEYIIAQYSPNDDMYNSYDILVLSRKTKGGA
ncbi:phage head closure protein [Bartonella sp. CL71SXKL]|uniref:phage head closure protein n=1 Tax=Bartonella sp. CL71SXKL TaxID=3243540 RepID=UPI0035D10B8F